VRLVSKPVSRNGRPLVIGSVAIRKIFLTDVSGFFATGLLIYELYKGRRDVVLQVLLASSVICAVAINAVFNLAWLRDHTGQAFDDWTVATICLVSILLIIWATRIRHLPISTGTLIAMGGMTYPLYLLHQQIGYDVINRVGPIANPGRGGRNDRDRGSGVIVGDLAFCGESRTGHREASAEPHRHPPPVGSVHPTRQVGTAHHRSDQPSDLARRQAWRPDAA